MHEGGGRSNVPRASFHPRGRLYANTEPRSLLDDERDSVASVLVGVVGVALFDGHADIVAVLSLCEVWKSDPLRCRGGESVPLLFVGVPDKEGAGDGDVEPRPLLEGGDNDERLDEVAL